MSSLIEMTDVSRSSRTCITQPLDKEPITVIAENHQRPQSPIFYVSQIKSTELPSSVTPKDRWALFSLLQNSPPLAQEVITDWSSLCKGHNTFGRVKRLTEALLFLKFLPDQKNPWIKELYKSNPLTQEFLEEATQVENARDTNDFCRLFANMRDKFKWELGVQSRQIDGLILYGDKEALAGLFEDQGNVGSPS